MVVDLILSLVPAQNPGLVRTDRRRTNRRRRNDRLHGRSGCPRFFGGKSGVTSLQEFHCSFKHPCLFHRRRAMDVPKSH